MLYFINFQPLLTTCSQLMAVLHILKDLCSDLSQESSYPDWNL